MSALVKPAVVASLLVALAALIHPALRSGAWLPGREAAVAAVALLVTVSLVARATTAPRRLGTLFVAAGAAVVLGAVAGDGLRGHHGRLDLVPGQSRTHFEEAAADGRSLGLRPLGFAVGLESVRPGGGVALVFSGDPAPRVLTTEEAVGFGGLRFGRPRIAPTGSVSRLRISISGGGADQIVEVSPGRPTRVGDMSLVLEDYFPDFALDEQRQPFTRSQEARNPGAILDVETAGRRYRVFVLQAMPGVHRIEEIDRSFSLLGVEPERAVEIDVHREPLALGALLGALLILVGVALAGVPTSTGDDASPRRRETGVPLLVGGIVLLVVVALVDDRGVLAWSFGLGQGEARVALPFAGVTLGLSLLAAAAGVLLVGAGMLAPAAAAVRAGAHVLGAAAAGAFLGAIVALVKSRSLDEATRGSAAPVVALLCAAAGLLAFAVLDARRDGSATSPAWLAWAGRVTWVGRVTWAATGLAVVAAVFAGLASWWRLGAYGTPVTAGAAAAAILGLAALEPEPRLAGARRALLLAALVWLVVV